MFWLKAAQSSRGQSPVVYGVPRGSGRAGAIGARGLPPSHRRCRLIAGEQPEGAGPSGQLFRTARGDFVGDRSPVSSRGSGGAAAAPLLNNLLAALKVDGPQPCITLLPFGPHLRAGNGRGTCDRGAGGGPAGGFRAISRGYPGGGASRGRLSSPRCRVVLGC